MPVFECRLLGNVEVRVDGRPVDLGPARQRCILVALLVDANAAVGVDQLIDRVWGERPPLRVRGSLYSHMTRLRKALTPAPLTIAGRSGTYTLSTDEKAIDLHRFRRLMGQARAEADDERALALAEQALDLWRGEPFGGLDTPWLADLRAELERERLAARLDHAELALRRGRPASLVPALSTLAAEFPLDERIAGLLMLALYRTGRQADALAHYRRVRLRLAEELGTDPGPELRQVHQRVLTADLAPATWAPVVVPRQLPAAPFAFTGRTDHLAALSTALDQGNTAVISAIRGAGGIGKTWLALAWAHRNLDRFPDGQLFVDLRGFSPESAPMAPEAAVRGLLEGLGVDPGRVPAQPQAQTGLLRSLLAHRRMLLVLDNAADAEQVAPLLPGGDSCTVLVTSRRTLTGLITRHGAQHLALDTLGDDEARDLLTRRLGAARTAADPAAAGELVSLCGGLPLALGIIAGRALAHPRAPLAEFAAELRELGLGALEDDPGTGLSAVLSWSVRALTDEQRTVFGLLGVAPGPDIGLPAAASLTGLSPARAARTLQELEEVSLLRRDPRDRYSMHDLVRQCATDLPLPAEVRTDALRRVVGFYTRTAYAADGLLAPTAVPPPLPPPAGDTHPLPDSNAIMAWLDTEHTCLQTAQRTAAAHGWHEEVWQLAWGLNTFHSRLGRRRDRLAAWQAALTAAEHLDHPAAHTLAHRVLGHAHALLGGHDEGIGHLHQALALSEQQQDHDGQALIHRTLAWSWGSRNDVGRALEHATRALDLYRVLGNLAWQARVLNQVGWYHARLGDLDQAREHCQATLALLRDHPDDNTEASALDSLGYIEHHAGRHEQAISRYRPAITLFRELGSTYEIANSLDGLGHPLLALDRRDEAVLAWREAMELYRDQGRDADADRLQRELKTLQLLD